MRSADFLMDSNALVDVYIAWFSGRTDLYVRNAAEVVREPILPEVIRQAVEHRYPVSAYTATDEGTTHVGAIDFDTDDGLDQARKVVRTLARAQVPSILAHSRRGAHVWIISWEPVAAATMRRALSGAMARAGLSADPKIEVFPKRGDGLACGALRLPGLPHQRTQEVYPVEILDDDGWQTLGPDLIDLLEATMPAEKTAIEKLAQGYRPKHEYPKGLGGFYGYKPDREWGPTPKASEELERLWGVTVVPGRTVRCPKHEDKRRSLTVMKDDERVFCGSPGCVLHGGGHGVGSVALSRMQA